MEQNQKTLIIINGRGGVGKDTLCDLAAKHYRVRNVSSITPIKKIAAENGWTGGKTPKDRKFLADLKELFTAYNELPTRYLLDQYREFLSGDEELMFAHIREASEIQKFKDAALLESGAGAAAADREHAALTASTAPTQKPCLTLLIKRQEEGVDKWGNAADDDVENYDYDAVYENSKPLLEAEEDFMCFLVRLLGQQR